MLLGGYQNRTPGKLDWCRAHERGKRISFFRRSPAMKRKNCASILRAGIQRFRDIPRGPGGCACARYDNDESRVTIAGYCDARFIIVVTRASTPARTSRNISKALNFRAQN